MAYNDQISYLKNALSGYSAEEEKLSELYKSAIANAETAHAAAMKQLETQYQDDRNEAYADIARDERNLNTVLANRGLGFSGEAAQAKLNSNISLSNRLGALSKEKYNNALQLDLDLADKRTNLSIDEAEKLRDILNSKNDLSAEIAGLELERETEAAKLKAEKDMQAAALQAEQDMFAAELNAKYGSSGSGGTASDSSSSSSSAETIIGEADKEVTSEGYIPNITAKELAKQLIKTATSGSGYIDDERDAYLVNKYLLELNENYGVDEGYMDDLIFLLKSYGYTEIPVSEMRRQVISYDAEAYYDDIYDTSYDRYVLEGMTESAARRAARNEAFSKQLDYIYGRCNTKIEFEICCSEMGISNSKVKEYLASVEEGESESNSGSGTGYGFGSAAKSTK